MDQIDFIDLSAPNRALDFTQHRAIFRVPFLKNYLESDVAYSMSSGATRYEAEKDALVNCLSVHFNDMGEITLGDNDGRVFMYRWVPSTCEWVKVRIRHF